MKKTTATNFLYRTAALLLALLLAVPPGYASAGERRLQTERTLTEGLLYRNTVTENAGSRVESFSLERSPYAAVRYRKLVAVVFFMGYSFSVCAGRCVRRSTSYYTRAAPGIQCKKLRKSIHGNFQNSSIRSGSSRRRCPACPRAIPRPSPPRVVSSLRQAVPSLCGKHAPLSIICIHAFALGECFGKDKSVNNSNYHQY